MELYEQARREFHAIMGSTDAKSFKELATKYKALINDVRQTVSTQHEGGFESAEYLRKMNKVFRKTMSESSATDFSSLKDLDIETDRPDRPEAMHKNLRALFETARRRHGLSC